MEEALDQLRAKDTKQRMAALERLRQLLEASTRPLSSPELTSIVDTCLDLLIDGSFRISQGALLALASAAVLAGDHLQIHFNALLPAAVDRLGDAKQPVRDAARRLLLTLMEVLSPTIIVERAGSFAWEHKSSRVREEFARTLTSAINLFASTELPLQRAALPPILHMLNDPDQVVREAATCCIEEMYRQIGQQFRDELQRHQLPSYMVKDINTRLERIGPKSEPSDGINFTSSSPEFVNLNPKKSSPKAKVSSRETPLFEGGGDNDEKPVEPLNVYSERQLLKEFEKVASTLVPEKDWSNRISAMQRVEALVAGGATDYPCFGGLLKQLVGPLCTQLSDRRSSIVKQVCHLLSFLSKELLGDFEACAEMFIPVLFKLVVITVLVIAESADSCIKMLLRNCKVARILPRIADCAKNDRNPVLRARCCDYALLILEHWADAAEIQRSVGLYEDLIKCCVGDAMSEVRSTARTCYRLFAKTWPDRSRWLFQSFDPAVQRIINEEDGGIHMGHASPSICNRNAKPSGYGTSAIVAMEKTAKLTSGPLASSGLQLSHSRPLSRGSEGSLQNIVHSSKKKVTAMESMLRGLDMSRKHNSSIRQTASLDLGVNRPSSRDYSLPLAAPVSNHLAGSLFLDSKLSAGGLRNNRNGSLAFSDITSQIQASRDAGKLSYHSGVIIDGPPAATSYPATRVPERLHERALYGDLMSAKEARRYMNSHVDRQYSDTPYRETNLRDSHSSYDHSFHRPLPAKDANGRVSAGRRKSLDGGRYPSGAMPSYTEGPSSLGDALSLGLSPASDWCLKVAAFNYIRSLLQQGPRGIQEVTQSFDKVMKLFFKHIDDPHHKVAQAALLTLVEVVPSCRKPFESYVERILPHVFSRLIDPKELVRQPCSSALNIVGKTYGVDSLLPALLRSLDEQRSPKAKLAVIEFANDSFKKHPSISEGSVNHGILRLWLAKLTPFMHDKNSKLKEATITCFISTYSHYDPSTTLNYILSLSVAEQNSLRRAIKQYTPRVEVDLMNYLQSKKDRQNSRSSYEEYDAARLSSEEGYMGLSKKSHFIGRYASGSLDIDGGWRWSSEVESARTSDHVSPSASDEAQERSRENLDLGYSYDALCSKSKDEFMNSEHLGVEARLQHDNGVLANLQPNDLELASLKISSTSDVGLNIPRILHSICDENNEGRLTAGKRDALEQIIDASLSNDQSLWIKYFDQILSAVLKALDDSDPSVRELALSLVAHMLNNQKGAIEDSFEVMIERLLRVSMDSIPKVANEGENCLTTVLTQYDPFRCLIVIVPLLITDDEKTLTACINCVSKLVSRVSQEELMARLSSFLPALFDAFEHKSPDVRKTVVFCLVDIYLKLGKAFVPYLEGLNSSQLKLVTIYANRISQARTGKPIDASQN